MSRPRSSLFNGEILITKRLVETNITNEKYIPILSILIISIYPTANLAQVIPTLFIGENVMSWKRPLVMIYYNTIVRAYRRTIRINNCLMSITFLYLPSRRISGSYKRRRGFSIPIANIPITAASVRNKTRTEWCEPGMRNASDIFIWNLLETGKRIRM